MGRYKRGLNGNDIHRYGAEYECTLLFTSYLCHVIVNEVRSDFILFRLLFFEVVVLKLERV